MISVKHSDIYLFIFYICLASVSKEINYGKGSPLTEKFKSPPLFSPFSNIWGWPFCDQCQIFPYIAYCMTVHALYIKYS